MRRHQAGPPGAQGADNCAWRTGPAGQPAGECGGRAGCNTHTRRAAAQVAVFPDRPMQAIHRFAASSKRGRQSGLYAVMKPADRSGGQQVYSHPGGRGASLKHRARSAGPTGGVAFTTASASLGVARL